MNCENIDLENKLELILKEINYLGSQQTPSTNSTVSIVVQEDRNKSRSCKQFDSLNYSLEMHKVRKNKKADFDIYSNNKLSIEDENIDKCEVIDSWKELSIEQKNIYIDNYSITLFELYNNTISREDILCFITKNINKIKYDKVNKCIIDVQGLNYKLNNNIGELSIKKIINTNKNSRLNKLRKSLKKK